jgi:hypothetical protein
LFLLAESHSNYNSPKKNFFQAFLNFSLLVLHMAASVVQFVILGLTKPALLVLP